MRIDSIVLENRWLVLEPLSEEHRGPLRDAISGDEDSWAVMSTTAYGEAFDGWFEGRMIYNGTGAGAVYAMRLKETGRIVGTSGLHDFNPTHRRCEIGSTVLSPEARGGVVNPASKRLLMGHAFDSGVIRLEIITDARNERSQAAIAKLGAVREAVLRQHKITWTGHIRDTVMFSILASEWPAVRDGLDARLAKFA